MLRGIYTAASGMLVDQRRMDVIASNLANVSTVGYKRESSLTQSFHSLYVVRTQDQAPDSRGSDVNFVGMLGIGTLAAQTATKLITGPMKMTGNALDVGIVGDGFFTINTPAGIRYTRNGSFRQNDQGTLVTPDGYEVLVDGAPVSSTEGTMRIDRHGEVWAGETTLGRLSIATVRDLGSIRKEGNGMWALVEGNDPPVIVTPEANGVYELRPGYLEQSNVEPVTEMVEMIATMRSYEASQRTLQAMDQALERAASEVGRIG